MRTIGLIGGMSWESSLLYYQIINEAVKTRLGGLHSARCLLWSFDFAEIEALQATDDWPQATQRMIEAAQALERGGAEGLVICTNTMHRMADAVQAAVDLPLIHIADATAEAIKAAGLQRIALLGSVNAVTEDGILVATSATSGQIGPYANTAGKVILVVGSQKIVPDLDTAMRRIHEHVLPWEEEQLRKAANIGTFVGKTLIIEREWLEDRMTVILVREAIGI